SRFLTLLVTDGRLEGEDPERVVSLAAALRRAEGGLSILAVGADADLDFLARLAGPERRPVRVGSAGEVEAAFLESLLRTEGTGKVLLGERGVRVGPGRGAPFTGRLAPVAGLVRAQAREGAEVWYVADGDLPLVAGWRYGLGTAIAVTTDPLSDWAQGWRETGILGKLADRAARSASLSTGRFESSVAAGRLRVSAHLRWDAAEVEGRLARPGDPPLPLRLVAAGEGLHVGAVPAPRPGAARLTITAGPVLLDAGISVPYPDEYRSTGPDPRALSELEAALGRSDSPPPASVDASAVPALLALLLLLLDRAWLVLAPRSLKGARSFRR
ncbi:MAG: hypothetical protein ACYS99_19960, partial [Planctomycetota bacterium]